MATEAHFADNKQNTQKSSEPRTKVRQRKSAQSSLQNGLYTRRTVVPGENRRQFQAIAAALVKKLLLRDFSQSEREDEAI